MANRGVWLALLIGCEVPDSKSDGVLTDDSAAGSGEDDGGSGSSGGSGGSSGGSGGSSGGSSGGDSHADDSGDSGGDDSDPPDPPPWSVRFVALGDTGEGNDEQYLVAAAMETVCAARGCDFALLLGDNIYESGVDSETDAQFQEKFELPYAYLDFTFYVTLGNHDYGGAGAGTEFWKDDYQIAYSDHSDKWELPSNYYTFSQEDVDFFSLDSNAIFWGVDDDQQAWLDDALAASDAGWKIVFGHHPYISNGDHGNAGNYEGLDWLPIVNGENVLSFMEDSVCGRADVYICGHDHSRQWLEPTCDTEFIVSGAGAKITEIVERDSNPYYFQESSTGFLWVEITETEFTGVFYDSAGTEQFSRTITR